MFLQNVVLALSSISRRAHAYYKVNDFIKLYSLAGNFDMS